MSANSLNAVKKTKPGTTDRRKSVAGESANKKIELQRSNAKLYKERKEKYIKDLESTLCELLSKKVQAEAEGLMARLEVLRQENRALKQLSASFGSSPSTVSEMLSATDPLVSLNMFSELNLNTKSPESPELVGTTTASNIRGKEATQTEFWSSPPPTSEIQFETFKETHQDMLANFATLGTASSTSNSSDLVSLFDLLNTPLAIAPEPLDIIEPHFTKAAEVLKSLPSLKECGDVVDDLISFYVRFIKYMTDIEPYLCKWTLGHVQIKQCVLLDKCESNPNDRKVAQNIFDFIRETYSIKDCE